MHLFECFSIFPASDGCTQNTPSENPPSHIYIISSAVLALSISVFVHLLDRSRKDFSLPVWLKLILCMCVHVRLFVSTSWIGQSTSGRGNRRQATSPYFVLFGMFSHFIMGKIPTSVPSTAQNIEEYSDGTTEYYLTSTHLYGGNNRPSKPKTLPEALRHLLILGVTYPLQSRWRHALGSLLLRIGGFELWICWGVRWRYSCCCCLGRFLWASGRPECLDGFTEPRRSRDT